MRKPGASVMKANGVDRAREARRTLREVTAAAAAGASLRAEEAARDARRRYRLERLSAGRGPNARGVAARRRTAGSTMDGVGGFVRGWLARRRARERAAADARWIEPSDEAEGIVPTRPEHEEAETGDGTSGGRTRLFPRTRRGARRGSRATRARRLRGRPRRVHARRRGGGDRGDDRGDRGERRPRRRRRGRARRRRADGGDDSGPATTTPNVAVVDGSTSWMIGSGGRSGGDDRG